MERSIVNECLQTSACLICWSFPIIRTSIILQPIKITARWVSQSTSGMLIIKCPTETAFLSPSVVARATVAIPETPKTSSSSASETTTSSSSSSSSPTSSKTTSELLYFQLWELCGNSQLPPAAILPILLQKNQAECRHQVNHTVQ